VFNVDSTTGECGQEIDLGVVEEIVPLALETLVRLLFNLELHITGLDARHLISLTAEVDLGTVLHTAVDVDVQHLSLDDSLLAVALFALVLFTDALTLTTAIRAHGLEALDHGTHLAHHRLHTLTIASGASLDGALLTTAAFTFGADDGFLEGELGDLAAVDVLERDLVDVVDGASFLRAWISSTHAAEHASKATTTSAKELGEQVLGGHTAGTSAALFQTLFTILIVDLALLSVREDFVGM
jgi:hypothetical protein